MCSVTQLSRASLALALLAALSPAGLAAQAPGQAPAPAPPSAPSPGQTPNQPAGQGQGQGQSQGQSQGQAPASPRSDSLRLASRLDSEGETVKAREIFQRLVDGAPDPRAKAAAQRAMAMSYAFDGDCANTVRLERQVIDFWKTREKDEPQNAFYQQGEMANEAARVCIDAGALDTAERYYRLGSELGNREPEPRTHPKALWDYRLAHALARLAARRGDKAEAQRQVAEARRVLDANPAMAEQQERFFPYLVGYVALYTGNLAGAETAFTRAMAVSGNQNDPFVPALLAMTYERMGQRDRARALFQKAYDLAGRAHNPPAAHVRPLARKKLAAP